MSYYAELEQRLTDKRTGKPVDTRHVAHATILRRRDDGSIAVRYHDTDVVSVSPDEIVTLNTDDYRTVTTKARINDWARGINVYSRHAAWHVSRDGHDEPYYDGYAYHAITLESQADEQTLELARRQLAAERALRKQISDYVKVYDLDVARDVSRMLIANDRSGDCWYCLMSTQDGMSLGDVQGTHEHLEAHLEDYYYFPSLIARVYMAHAGEQWERRLAIDTYALAETENNTYILDRQRRLLRRYVTERLLPVVRSREVTA